MSTDRNINNRRIGLKRKLTLILIVICLVGAAVWLVQNPKQLVPRPFKKNGAILVERKYPIMGTVARITLSGNNEKLLNRGADKVQKIFGYIERRFNYFDPNSELSKLNRVAKKRAFTCSPQMWRMLKRSRRAYDISKGTFDVTARPYMELWGFNCQHQKGLPTPSEIKKISPSVGLYRVVFDDKRHTVRFKNPNMAIDFGGIAKGVAVQQAARAIMKMGIKSGIIDLGGNMYCLPDAPDLSLGKNFHVVGIRNPLHRTRIAGIVALLDQAVATSGNYERFVEIGGKTYGHIINPRTGSPIANRLSVTVVCPNAADADFLSTSIFILGKKFAREIVERFQNTGIVLIEKNLKQNNRIEVLKYGTFKHGIKLRKANELVMQTHK